MQTGRIVQFDKQFFKNLPTQLRDMFIVVAYHFLAES
jgi:hypothetical protein